MCLVDNAFFECHFSLIDEEFELFVDQRNEIRGRLPCQIDVFEHIKGSGHSFELVIEYSQV